MKRFSFFVFFLFLVTACNVLKNENVNFFPGYWLEYTTPDRVFVQGFELKKNGTAQSIGMATLKYEAWRVEGPFLVLSGKSIGNGQTIAFSEKQEIVEINDNVLKLRNSNGRSVNYYRVEKMPDL